MELADRTQRDFAHKEEELSGEVAIGSGETRSMTVLAEILSDFRQQYPRVSYRFYSGNADHIKERIENGTLDIGLLPEPVDIARYEFLRVPVMEEWGVLTREDSPLTALEVVRPQDLVGRPLMVSGRELVQNELANWLGDDAQRRIILIRYNHFVQHCHAGEKRLWGCAVHPGWTASIPVSGLFPCHPLSGWAPCWYGKSSRSHRLQSGP